MGSRRDRAKSLNQAFDDLTRHHAEVDTTKPRYINLSEIIVDEDIQVRVSGIDMEYVEQLMNVLDNGGTLDPIDVYEDEAGKFWLADGFHRVEAHRQLNIEQIKSIVHQGGYDGAIEHAETANLEHGLRLSNDDKKFILARRLVRDHQWKTLSNRELAKNLGVSAMTIGRWMESLEGVTNVTRDMVVGADGKVYNSEKISQRESKRKRTSKPAWTPKKAKSRLFKITETLSDDDLFTALNELEDTDRDEAFGRLYDLRKRLDDLLGE